MTTLDTGSLFLTSAVLKPLTNKLFLNLNKKPSNSPILSIQHFMYEQLMHSNIKTNYDTYFSDLWQKYAKLESNSLLISTHKLTFDDFKHIVSNIFYALEPFQIGICHGANMQSKKISNDDLIERFV